MTSLGSIYPRPLLLSPLPSLLKPHESNLFFFPRNRHNLLIVKSSFNNFHIPELESATQDLFNRAEGFIYTLADAVVNSTTVADHVSVIEESKKNGDWLSGITGYMEFTLKVLKDGLSALHVPYSYGFAIILLTVIVKAATFPLTKKQVESAMAMRSLQPQVKAIQKLYAGDQERIQSEMARLYKVAGVNPLAGCLPTLATIPVWIGLYRALSNVADEGLLTEGFFWIPTLSGPTTIAARQSGSGISWLFPFVDGHPPLGWHDTLSYLVLPVLLVISQYISAQVIQPVQSNDANQKSAQAVTKFLPLIIGYFALSVPSGLSLYWFTNNVLSTAQQIWLQKLGGAKNPVKKFTDISYSDDTSEAEQSTSQIQKSINVLDTGKVNSSPQVKAESNNLRRGDRFKQLKEQEARRRKQREEEKGQAEEKGRNRNSDVDSRIIEQNKSEDQILDKTNEKDSGDDLKVINSSSTENGRLHSRVGPQINGEGFQENRQEDQISEQHGPSSNLTPLDQREHESDDI